MLFSALVLEAVFHQNSEVFFLATTNHPEHGKHRRQRSAGFAAAAVVGKVLGTLVLIGVITLTWSIAKSIYGPKNKK